MSPAPASSQTVSRGRRWGWFVAATGVLAVLWLVVFPAIARRPQMAERIRAHDEQGIDPSAIFYSELDAMPDAEQRIRRARSGSEDPLW